MIRKIISIDGERCNGCGLCAEACHEGAIGMIEGVARLMRDDYCDGLGDCLPVCPTGAITFVEREALEYNEAEVKRNAQAKIAEAQPCSCPGSRSHARSVEAEPAPCASRRSQLMQWPVQIKLVPTNATFFDDARLLIAADCTAYAYAGMHEELMKGRVTLIGCPKLDAGDYSEKLAEILRRNNIRSVTIVRMEVPCCGGLEHVVKRALEVCGKILPWQVITISTDGRII